MSEPEKRPAMTDAPPGRAQGHAARAANIPDGRIAAERELQDREVQQDPEMADEDRLEMFRDSLQQSVLPDLPPMPGFHVCWLTTANPRDSIVWRRRIGYELIREESCPGWEGTTVKAGEYAGVIGVNEMVAARIPLRLYNRYMAEVHHFLPLQEEEKLRAKVEAISGELESRGSRIDQGDGTANVVQRAKPMAAFQE